MQLNIRDVPDEVRDDLAGAARRQNMSLQKYLLKLVITEAKRAHNRAAIARAAERIRRGGGVGDDVDVTALIQETRDERDEQIIASITGGSA
jgi:antitoxin FitA